MKRLTPDETEKLELVRFNPLAEYKLQTADKKKNKGKSLSETSLSQDVRIQLGGFDLAKKFYFKEDVGNFEFSQVILSAKNRDLILKLRASTQKLFLWILFQLNYRDDTIELDLTKMKSLGFKMSTNNFRKSIAELSTNNILCRIGQREKDETYWLFFFNPQVVWRGDAKKFYKDVLSVHPEYNNDASGKADV